MQKTDKWSEQIAYYRFFNNEKVREETLIECAVDHCAKACEGMEEVLLIQDTTELNLESHRKRITDMKGLGEVGNGTEARLFLSSNDSGESPGWWTDGSGGYIFDGGETGKG